MFPIAHILSQHQRRRSLTGALATDPVVPERRNRTRMTRVAAVHVTRAPARVCRTPAAKVR